MDKDVTLTRLSDDDIQLWCELYVIAVGEHSRRLSSARNRCTQPVDNEDPYGLLERLKEQQRPGHIDLITALRFIEDCESRFRADPAMNEICNLKADVDSTTYTLIDTRPGPIAENLNRSFALRHDLGVYAGLGLSLIWTGLSRETELHAEYLEELDALRYLDTLKIGLAPFSDHTHMHWHWDESALHPEHGFAPLCCQGAQEPDEHRASILSVLEQAYAENVQILILPELLVDEALLKDIQNWLRHNNLANPRIRLLVAGTRHVPTGDGGFVNQATVLGTAGQILWSQNKTTPFHLPEKDYDACFKSCQAPGLYEPVDLSTEVHIRGSVIGCLAVAICIDYLENEEIHELGIDAYLIPALSHNLSRFRATAKEQGYNASVSLIANGRLDNPLKERAFAYLPQKEAVKLKEITPHLHTLTIHLNSE